MSMTTYNPQAVEAQWDIIRHWDDASKRRLVTLIVASMPHEAPQGMRKENADNDKRTVETPVEGKKMKGKKKHYEIDDIMGILACDKDDQQLLDEYLAEKYHE